MSVAPYLSDVLKKRKSIDTQVYCEADYNITCLKQGATLSHFGATLSHFVSEEQTGLQNLKCDLTPMATHLTWTFLSQVRWQARIKG